MIPDDVRVSREKGIEAAEQVVIGLAEKAFGPFPTGADAPPLVLFGVPVRQALGRIIDAFMAEQPTEWRCATRHDPLDLTCEPGDDHYPECGYVAEVRIVEQRRVGGRE